MEILIVPNEILTIRSEPVTDFALMNHYFEQMQTLMDNNPLAGLSANQVGVLRRFFIMNMNVANQDADSPDYRFFVNPTYTPSKQKGRKWDWEGCASIPNLQYNIERWQEIHILSVDENGNDVSMTLKGHLARAVQHEIDHLNGVLISGKRNRGRRVV